FDKTDFGTSDFAEQVNYRRALEGELERTIGSLGEVEKARVHLTLPKESIFTESRQPAKASVLLNLKRTVTLSTANIAAIAHLVANAVEGLNPSQITIVSSQGELLNKPRGDSSLASMPGELLEYRAAMEHELQNKLTQTLDPVLGFGNYRTGVSVETDFSGVEENEEVWDPTRSVMVSSQRTEESSNNPNGATQGVPGTQSSLPDPAPRPAASGSGTTRTSENTSYQTSRKVRHVDQPRGAVKRITIAVLLDQESKWEQNGTGKNLVLTPPPPEKLAVIRNLVTNVAGINPERGDQITVESLPFDSTVHQEPPTTDKPKGPATQAAPVSALDRIKQMDPKTLGGMGAVALLILGLSGWMLSRSSKKKKVTATATAALAAANAREEVRALDAGIVTFSPEEQARLEKDLVESLKLPARQISKADTLAKYLRQEVKRDPQAATQMLRAWILEEEHSAK
ncbi:MAG: flagellar basal-body MS-ring/collar protein FliF, partial [Acidobacteriota bacterium]